MVKRLFIPSLAIGDTSTPIWMKIKKLKVASIQKAKPTEKVLFFKHSLMTNVLWSRLISLL